MYNISTILCPLYLSCGTVRAYWTDDDAPTTIGVPATINVYLSVSDDYSTDCKYTAKLAEVMRCSLSTDHDLIYRYNGTY